MKLNEKFRKPQWEKSAIKFRNLCRKFEDPFKSDKLLHQK